MLVSHQRSDFCPKLANLRTETCLPTPTFCSSPMACLPITSLGEDELGMGADLLKPFISLAFPFPLLYIALVILSPTLCFLPDNVHLRTCVGWYLLSRRIARPRGRGITSLTSHRFILRRLLFSLPHSSHATASCTLPTPFKHQPGSGALGGKSPAFTRSTPPPISTPPGLAPVTSPASSPGSHTSSPSASTSSGCPPSLLPRRSTWVTTSQITATSTGRTERWRIMTN